MPHLLKAQNTKCAECGKQIKPGQNYLVVENKKYCSEKCYNKTLPKCSVCGKQTAGGFRNSAGKFFCSKDCLSQSWPKCSLCGKPSADGMILGGADGKFFCPECSSKTRCFCCDMPDDCSILGDGRYICRECSASSVADEKKFIEIIEDVRQKMKDKMDLGTDHDIKYRLVDINTLQKVTPGESVHLEMGIYKYEENIQRTTTKKTNLFSSDVTTEIKEEKISEKHKIFLLSDMSKAKMIEVSAHELAHDWMQAYYPLIGNVKVKEGWAEYVAWRINKIYKNEKLNPRIEQNSNDIYGGGFRMIKKIADKKGIDGLKELFRTENSNRQTGNQ